MNLRHIALLALLATGTGCTTIGMDKTEKRDALNYGATQDMRVCFLKTDDVPDERIPEIVTAVNKEFAPYGITVSTPWTRPWTRPGFTVYQILPEVAARELEEPCDRLIALVDRHIGDVAWSLFMPVVLGAVEGLSHTHGYIVATYPSSPSVAVHEFYHLLGCHHALIKTECYGKIAELKASRPPQSDFFPAISEDGKFLHTRAEAMEVLRVGLEEEKLGEEALDEKTLEQEQEES